AWGRCPAADGTLCRPQNPSPAPPGSRERRDRSIAESWSSSSPPSFLCPLPALSHATRRAGVRNIDATGGGRHTRAAIDMDTRVEALSGEPGGRGPVDHGPSISEVYAYRPKRLRPVPAGSITRHSRPESFQAGRRGRVRPGQGALVRALCLAPPETP